MGQVNRAAELSQLYQSQKGLRQVINQVAAGIPETQTSLRTLQHSTAYTIKGHIPISYPQ